MKRKRHTEEQIIALLKGGCRATSSRERATSNRWSISRSGARTATLQSHGDVWRWTLRVVAAD